MQKELESGNLYVVLLVSLKCLKNWDFVPTQKQNNFLCDSYPKYTVCKAPLNQTSTNTNNK